MKTRIHRADCQGSALLLTLGTTLVIGIAMASYLVFVANQTRSTMRSQSWNSCVPVMEAGVEEALSQINYQGPTNLGTNGWTLGADALYHKTRWFGDSYCDVSIQPLDPPVIFSTGYVPGPAPTASVTGM
ncbi:MAG TPA: hypothetical protein VK639_21820, partial [Terriglobales bacterium]|nr:hypothetical protein [Terriglobales bacterium]